MNPPTAALPLFRPQLILMPYSLCVHAHPPAAARRHLQMSVADQLADPTAELTAAGIDAGTQAVLSLIEAARTVAGIDDAGNDPGQELMAATTVALRSAALRMRVKNIEEDRICDLLKSAMARLVAGYADEMRSEVDSDPAVRHAGVVMGAAAPDAIWSETLSEIWGIVDASVSTALKPPTAAALGDIVNARVALANRLVQAAVDSVAAGDDSGRLDEIEKLWRPGALLLITGAGSERAEVLAGGNARSRAERATASAILVFDSTVAGCVAARNLDAAMNGGQRPQLSGVEVVQCAARAWRWLMLLMVAGPSTAADTLSAVDNMWVDAVSKAAAATCAAAGVDVSRAAETAVSETGHAMMDALDKLLSPAPAPEQPDLR